MKNKKRKVIYTVITGDYDYLRTPKYVNEDYDYICFTNNKRIKSTFWKVRRIKNSEGLDDIRLQRYIKICPHIFLPKYELSVYIDANMRIIGDFDEYIDKYMGDSALLCVIHPDRTSVYLEAEECIRLGKCDRAIIDKQMAEYRESGFPDDLGLIASGVLVRKSMEVAPIMDEWWNEVREKSYRDQLSFNYCCWKHNYKYSVSDVHVYKNIYWLCPGIHTKDIEVVEDKLIDNMLLAAYRGWYIAQLENELKKIKEENCLGDGKEEL